VQSQGFSAEEKWSLACIRSLSLWQIDECKFVEVRTELCLKHALLCHGECVLSLLLPLKHAVCLVVNLERNLLAPDVLGALGINQEEALLAELMLNVRQRLLYISIELLLSLRLKDLVCLEKLALVFAGVCNHIWCKEGLQL